MPLDYITDNNVNKFYFIPVTENEVSNILGTIKDSVAVWDGLKAFTIKQIKEIIVTPLVHICNRSFMTGIFPDELKIANVDPICKSGDDKVFSSNRPVSVLPIFSKLFHKNGTLQLWYGELSTKCYVKSEESHNTTYLNSKQVSIVKETTVREHVECIKLYSINT